MMLYNAQKLMISSSDSKTVSSGVEEKTIF